MADDRLEPVRAWFADSGRVALPGSAPDRVPDSVPGPVDAVVSTVDAADGRAAAHWVRARRLDHGIVLGARRDAAVGADLAVTPETVVCLRSPNDGTPARITCVATRLGDLESDDLFDELGRAAQLRAWGRPDAREHFSGQLIPRPRGWVGYRLVPGEVEIGTAD